MGLNIYKVRKWGGFLITSMLPTIGFFIGLTYWGFGALTLGVFLIMVLVSVLLGSKMIETPFNLMLEGAGLLCLDLSSTGVIRPFIARVNQPYVQGKVGEDMVNDVYDRDTVLQLANPIKNGEVTVKNGKITVTFDEDAYNRNRFGYEQYPVLVYNSQLKSFITKDFISENEKLSFAEHGVLYLNRKLEELTSTVRDFGRYIVELTKPQQGFFQKYPWMIWVLIIGGILILALFIGPILKQVAPSIGGAFETVSSTGPNSPVTPQ